MSTRVRLIYEKRGGACFVPHISLASLFTRSALRAGLSLTLTQGFSPHPKMSFGPELPAGVVALNEPVDIWMESVPEEILERWNAAMPEGFRLISALFPAEDSPKLGSLCQAALYWIRCSSLDSETLLEMARLYYGGAVVTAEAGLDIEENGREEWLSLVLSAPAQNAIGGWVRFLIEENRIAGWQDLNIVRAAVGIWDGEGVCVRMAGV